MPPGKPSPHKLPSLADYLVRYDLAAMQEEALLDYREASAGAPRMLKQQDITARFRKPAPPPKEVHEPG